MVTQPGEPMVWLLDSDEVTRRLVESAVSAALRELRRPLIAQVAVGMAAGADWRARATNAAGLVILSPRPTALGAAWALVAGALAYLPLDMSPSRLGIALHRAARGRLHIEPESAAALIARLALEGQSESSSLRSALALARAGWPWTVSARDVGLDPGRAAGLLLPARRSTT